MKKHALAFLASFFWLIFLGLFYYVYVPLTAAFQVAFAPILLVVFVATFVDREKGFLVFVALLPLIGSLPYLLGIGDRTPHAPTALVLFLVFFFAWLVRGLWTGPLLRLPRGLARPAALLSAVVAVSGVVTFLRYANFFPFRTGGIYEIVVNANGVRAGGALMSVVFGSLTYLSGLLLVGVAGAALRDDRQVRRVLIALSSSLFVALLFALVQKYHSIALGNLALWVRLRQINSTFKDPNSFGAVLSAVFPVLLAFVFTSKRWRKLWPLLVLACALFVLPDIGSRSTLLGVGLASSILAVAACRWAWRRAGKKAALAFLAAGALVIGILAVLDARQSILSERLRSSIEALEGTTSSARLLTGRSVLWSMAWRDMREYPLTGIGPGSYIVELPNNLKAAGRRFPITDSSENVLLQAGSELGWIGLGLTLWLAAVIVKFLAVVLLDSRREFGSPLLILGAASGVAALLATFLFHSFIGGYEVVYVFWILVAVVAGRADPQPSAAAGAVRLPAPAFRRLVFATALVVAGLQAWSSTHSLSVNAHAERFGWSQDFGLYGPEKDERGASFRWAEKTAGISVERLGPSVTIPLLASHPDIKSRPVAVRFYAADAFFRKKEMVREVRLSETRWTETDLPLAGAPGTAARFVIETDRAWRPAEALGIADSRTLAVGLGEPVFSYPSTLPQLDAPGARSVAYDQWEGTLGRDLDAPGASRVRFRCPDGPVALRLWVKGEKALDVGPLVLIRLDGRTIAKTMLREETWQPLALPAAPAGGNHRLSVELVNAFTPAGTGRSRRVTLGRLEVVSAE